MSDHTDIDALVNEINEHCVGHPHAKIALPHRLLHKTRDALETLSARCRELEEDVRHYKTCCDAATKIHDEVATRLTAYDASVDRVASLAQPSFSVANEEWGQRIPQTAYDALLACKDSTNAKS